MVQSGSIAKALLFEAVLRSFKPEYLDELYVAAAGFLAESRWGFAVARRLTKREPERQARSTQVGGFHVRPKVYKYQGLPWNYKRAGRAERKFQNMQQRRQSRQH